MAAPPVEEPYALLELRLEWAGAEGLARALAAALRVFAITRDPLDWIPNRGRVWSTVNANGESLELPLYVLREELLARIDRAGGKLLRALGALAAETLAAVASREALADGCPELALGEATGVHAPAGRWEPVGLGAVQDLVQEAFGPVALDRSLVTLAPLSRSVPGCPACAGSGFGFPGELVDAQATMCPAHRHQAQAIADQRIGEARRGNPVGWRALGKGAARVSGGAEPPSAPLPPRRAIAVGRNDPCPCGSDRKYKHCCGR